MPWNTVDIRVIGNVQKRIPDSYGTDPFDIYPAEIFGSIVTGLVVTSDDTIAHTLAIGLMSGSNFHRSWSVAVPAGAGHGVVPPVDIFASLPVNWEEGIRLQSGVTLQGQLEEAMSTGKLMEITGFTGDF